MRAILAFLVMFGGEVAQADPLTGTREIKLVSADGTEQTVGRIIFEGSDGGTGYTLAWQAERFDEHFLSMRPFKCLEGPTKYWCRLDYPYENRRTISAEDLTDLEYDLLFIWKGAGEYGIDMWNGVYYRLQAEEDRLIGRLHEIDMGVLASPPKDGGLRPVRETDLNEADPDSHWLPVLIIE